MQRTYTEQETISLGRESLCAATKNTGIICTVTIAITGERRGGTKSMKKPLPTV